MSRKYLTGEKRVFQPKGEIYGNDEYEGLSGKKQVKMVQGGGHKNSSLFPKGNMYYIKGY